MLTGWTFQSNQFFCQYLRLPTGCKEVGVCWAVYVGVLLHFESIFFPQSLRKMPGWCLINQIISDLIFPRWLWQNEQTGVCYRLRMPGNHLCKKQPASEKNYEWSYTRVKQTGNTSGELEEPVKSRFTPNAVVTRCSRHGDVTLHI